MHEHERLVFVCNEHVDFHEHEHKHDILMHLLRLCCNPHIYTWCLVEGCLTAGGNVTAFAESIGLASENAADSPLAAEQARQRYDDKPE